MTYMIFLALNRIEVLYGLFGPASGRTHYGIDIDTTGDPTIHSTVSGKVKWARIVAKGAAGWDNTWEWGWFVWIVADDGTDHIFAHCKANSLLVKEGDRVTAGQAIATMGKTGNAEYDKQAEHVHYEVRKNNVAIDPTPWCGIPNQVGSWMNPGAAQTPNGTVQSYFLDISAHQVTFDAAKAKAAGIKGVMCRGAYASSKDRCFDKFTKDAHAAGLLVGSYLFATWHYSNVSGSYDAAVANAKKQAENYISILKTAPITSYVALDMEFESGVTTVLTAKQLTEISNLFMGMLEAAGYKAMLYANADWVFNRLVTAEIKYPIWLAYYYRNYNATDFADGTAGAFPDGTWGRRMAGIKDRLYMWQFTSSGYGDKYGVGSANLDKNYAYVDMDTSKVPGAGGEDDEDVKKYRVYDIVYASESATAAQNEFEKLVRDTRNEYILISPQLAIGGDNKWRIGHVNAAKESVRDAMNIVGNDQFLV